MKACILIGNGPSLNKIDINKLKGIDTFSFNRAYISYKDWGFDPTYYSVIDGNTIRCTVPDIKKLVNDKSSTTKRFFVNNVKNEFDFSDCDQSRLSIFKGFSGNLLKNKHGDWTKEIPSEITNLCLYSNITTFSIQLAYMLGYNLVGMVGVDAKYIRRKDVKEEGVYKSGPMKGKLKVKFTSDNDPNHYRSDYHGSNHLTSPDHLTSVSGNNMEPWKKIKEVLPKLPNFRVVSCTEGSTLNNKYFTYIPFNSFIKDNT